MAGGEGLALVRIISGGGNDDDDVGRDGGRERDRDRGREEERKEEIQTHTHQALFTSTGCTTSKDSHCRQCDISSEAETQR